MKKIKTVYMYADLSLFEFFSYYRVTVEVKHCRKQKPTHSVGQSKEDLISFPDLT